MSPPAGAFGGGHTFIFTYEQPHPSVVLLLSRTPAYTYLYKVIVAEVTTTVRGIPQELMRGQAEGLERSSVANFDNVHVVPTASLTEAVGRLAPMREREAKRALGYALGWPELMEL